MKYAFGFFCLLYLLALMLFLVGTFGWFGQERDPLSGIFLLPLGLPWNIVGDRMGLASAWLGVLTPILNGAILLWLWKRQKSG